MKKARKETKHLLLLRLLPKLLTAILDKLEEKLL